MKSRAMRRMILLLLLIATMAIGAAAAETGDTPGAIRYWLEKPNLLTDRVENFDNKDHFFLYKTERTGEVEAYLKTAKLGRRFAHLLGVLPAEDGSLDAYYARGLFTYTFDVFNEFGGMTIGGVGYDAQNLYTVRAKYEQAIAFPGLDNGLMPVCDDPEAPGAYCAGWALDQRVGDAKLLTYANAVTEDMLPADHMPYEDLSFRLTAMWYRDSAPFVLSSWYEEFSPDADAAAGRKSYDGKTYINYPATDFEIKLPKGSTPGASDAPGLTLVAQIAPDAGKPYPEGNTWYFLYDRQRFTLTLVTGGAEDLVMPDIPYRQNLAMADPGWDEGFTRELNGVTFHFTGWHQGDQFVGYRLSEMYMTPQDLTLEARWMGQYE